MAIPVVKPWKTRCHKEGPCQAPRQLGCDARCRSALRAHAPRACHKTVARMTSGAARWDSCNVRGIHPQAPVRSLERERLRYGASGPSVGDALALPGHARVRLYDHIFLTEQSAVDTSALSSSVGGLVEKGAWLVETGQSPSFVRSVKWAGERVLLLSYKFSNHGLSVRQQAHVVEFALLGGVVALNVLAWASGWAHRRGQSGRIRVAHVAHVCAVHARMCCG